MSQRLDAFVARVDEAALFLDFDGTLSPIVEDPEAARPLTEVGPLLARLRDRLRLVAVVSGRSAHQLLEWLEAPIEIWGVHGLEHVVDGHVVVDEVARPYIPAMRAVTEDARRRVGELDAPGILVEDKGTVVTLHYRAAADVKAAGRLLHVLAEELADAHGLRIAQGKLAYELRPPIAVSKGEIVRRRAREVGAAAAAFVGDDLVDLAGFDALDDLEESRVATLRVAVTSDEAPDELLTRADLLVDGPSGVVDLLKRLL